MEKWTDRSQILLGAANLTQLATKHVVVFGVGGVGGAALMGLVRSGVASFTLIDADCVAPSNLNRQWIATTETIGRPKVEVAAEWVKAINPAAQVQTHQLFLTPDLPLDPLLAKADLVLDCIDTVSAKLYLIEESTKRSLPILSAMGAGNRYDLQKLQFTDLAKTTHCTLARVMRRELRKRGIIHLPVVYSPESPQRPYAHEVFPDEAGQTGKLAPGSLAFVPFTSGLLLAQVSLRYLLGDQHPTST